MNVRAFLGSLSLIWVMAIPVTYPYLLQALKWQAKLEVKQKYLLGFVADELMFLEIPHWMEEKPNQRFTRIHSKEFVLDGQMYDIVEQQQTEQSTWYLVYPDRKETGLKKKLAQAVDMHEKHNDKKVPGLDSLAKSFVLFYKSVPKLHIDLYVLADHPLCPSSQLHRQWVICPDSPPPQASFLLS
jgi:hypothetical protein